MFREISYPKSKSEIISDNNDSQNVWLPGSSLIASYSLDLSSASSLAKTDTVPLVKKFVVPKTSISMEKVSSSVLLMSVSEEGRKGGLWIELNAVSIPDSHHTEG